MLEEIYVKKKCYLKLNFKNKNFLIRNDQTHFYSYSKTIYCFFIDFANIFLGIIINANDFNPSFYYCLKYEFEHFYFLIESCPKSDLLSLLIKLFALIFNFIRTNLLNNYLCLMRFIISQLFMIF